jgi:hypothetical protein
VYRRTNWRTSSRFIFGPSWHGPKADPPRLPLGAGRSQWQFAHGALGFQLVSRTECAPRSATPALQKPAVSSGFADGARRARTADLLGAISKKAISVGRRASSFGLGARFAAGAAWLSFAVLCHWNLTTV